MSLITTSVMFSQKVVISKDVEKEYKNTHGPNMRHYAHFYIGLGVLPGFDEEAGSEVKFPGSLEYYGGYRYKLKILPFYALGFDVSFRHTRYSLEGDDVNKATPGNPISFAQNEKRHILSNNSLNLGIYQRINIGKRGNTLGNYLDLGIEGSWNFSEKEIIVTTHDSDEYYAGKSRLVNRKLDFPEPLTYGVYARIGHNKWAVYGKYRLSDYFNDTWDIAELPALSVGLDLGF